MTPDQHKCASCTHVREGARVKSDLRCNLTGLAALIPCQRFEPSEAGLDVDEPRLEYSGGRGD